MLTNSIAGKANRYCLKSNEECVLFGQYQLIALAGIYTAESLRADRRHTAERCHNTARGREAHPGWWHRRRGTPAGFNNRRRAIGRRKWRGDSGEPCCSVQPRWGWRPECDRILGCANATPSFDVARRWRETAMWLASVSVPMAPWGAKCISNTFHIPSRKMGG